MGIQFNDAFPVSRLATFCKKKIKLFIDLYEKQWLLKSRITKMFFSFSWYKITNVGFSRFHNFFL